MRVDSTSGRVAGARFVPSPNADERPAGTDPELIVVHGISLPPGEFGGPAIEQLFTNTLDPAGHPYFAEIDHLRVSAHLLVRRDGELVQFVPLHMRAWHAGESEFRGRPKCNDFSIGIEMEGSDDTPYEAAQYETLARLCVALSWSYPGLTHNPIVGHSDIAPGRKTDPGGAFDWHALGIMVADLGGEMPSRSGPAVAMA